MAPAADAPALKGSVAIVTGAGSGIGRATAAVLAAGGAQLLLVGRDRVKLEAIGATIREHGGTAHAIAADLQHEAAVEAVFAELEARFGAADILVNCAGVGSSWAEVSPGSMDAIGEAPIETYREVMAINLDSVVLMSRKAIPMMRARGGGAIVNVSSIYGLKGAAEHHAYAMTKAAIIHLTKSMAVRYSREGIRVNCVTPGYIDTPMNDPVKAFFAPGGPGPGIIPMGRPGHVDEVAQVIAFLASARAAYVAGAVLPVDGGFAAT